jgi:hypothetical protein
MNPFGDTAEAPKLDMSGLLGREIRVRAGEPFDIDIPIKGSPTPTVAWTKDNKDVGADPRVSFNATTVLDSTLKIIRLSWRAEKRMLSCVSRCPNVAIPANTR